MTFDMTVRLSIIPFAFHVTATESIDNPTSTTIWLGQGVFQGGGAAINEHARLCRGRWNSDIAGGQGGATPSVSQ